MIADIFEQGYRWRLTVFFFCGFTILLLPTTVFSQTTPATEAGRESLRNRRYPWYDSANDLLKSPELPAKVPPKTARDWTYQAPKNSADLSWLWEMVKYFVWVLLIVLFAVVLFYAIKTFAENQSTTNEIQQMS